MKNVLVTGVAGFIASNMVKFLLDNTDYIVYGVDNFQGGRSNEFMILNLQSDRFTFKECCFSEIDNLFSDIQFSSVYHFAATPRVSYSVEYPIETNENNVSKTLKLLQYCVKKKVKRFIFSSSSSVYGNISIFPTNECTQKSPISPYALQKSTIEEYCRLYSNLYGLDTVSLRYFNVYGPGQYSENAYSTVICAWIRGFVEKTSIRLDGDGLQSRDFTYVEDVCRANLLVDEYIGNLNGEIFNVGCNNSTTLNDIFNILKKITEFEPIIDKRSKRLGDVSKTHADIDKIKKLGFNYQVDIEDGIDKTYNWYKNIINL